MSTLTVTTINSANGTTPLTLATGNTNAGDIIVNAGGGLVLASNSTVDAISVAANGNIGIGTSSPNFKLTTNGQFRVINGSSYVSINHDGVNGSVVNNIGSLLFYSEGATSTIFHTNGVSRGEFDSTGNFAFNSGYGSVATAYGCRAWVNFNGTGTVSIRTSGNISSITDNGVGNYALNFTVAMPDANYCMTGAAISNDGFEGRGRVEFHPTVAPTTSSCRITTDAIRNVQGAQDCTLITVAIFR
jgi:hypothetical protein